MRGQRQTAGRPRAFQPLHIWFSDISHRPPPERPTANDNGEFVVCQQGEQEDLLEQREQRCLLEAERLRCDREELEAQLQEYQQNLDRLREGQRSVEREKEKIETQQKLLQSWRHSRQSSLPVTLPLDGFKVNIKAGKRFF